MSEMSRKEAIKTIQEFYYPILSRFWLDEKKDVLADALEMAIEALKEQRPHGEWIKDFNMDKAPVCSECGEEAWYKEYCGWVTKSNFCPNCGADMRRKEGEAE